MILTCAQLVRAVTDAREGRLSAVNRLSYKLHLLRCRNCRRYVAQLDLIVETLRGNGTVEAPPAELHAALVEAFRQRRR